MTLLSYELFCSLIEGREGEGSILAVMSCGSRVEKERRHIMFFGLHGAVGRIGESDQTRHGYGVGAADFARGKVEFKS